MKNIKYTLMAAGFMSVAALLTSCEKQLDTVQNGVVSSSTFYEGDEACEEATTDIYYQNSAMIHDMLPYQNYWHIKTLLSDEIYHAGGTREDGLDARTINEYQFDYSNSMIEGLYEGMYEIIYRANLVINNFEDGTSDIQKRDVAEAKVFRAWCNFQLVTLWGNAPLVLEAVREDYKSSNSSKEALYAQIEKDLTEAINSGKLVQKSSMDDAVTGLRITKQYAQALLGKAYVFQKKWSDAITVLNQLENSNLYGFIDDYANHSLASYNNNREVLFGDSPTDDLSVSYGNAGIFPWIHLAPSGNFWNNIYFTDLSFVGFGWNNPSQTIVDAFLKHEPNSKRFKGTLKSYTDLAKQGMTLKENIEVYAHVGYFNWKWRSSSQSLISGSYYFYKCQFPMMEYNEVVLLNAEAKIMKDGAGAGDDDINLIRDKAGLPHLTGATMDDLKVEKQLECYLDGCRYDDLVRWGDAATVLANQGKEIPCLLGVNEDGTYKINKSRYTNTTYGWKANKNELLPYPQKEMNVNPNITQNPGW